MREGDYGELESSGMHDAAMPEVEWRREEGIPDMVVQDRPNVEAEGSGRVAEDQAQLDAACTEVDRVTSAVLTGDVAVQLPAMAEDEVDALARRFSLNLQRAKDGSLRYATAESDRLPFLYELASRGEVAAFEEERSRLGPLGGEVADAMLLLALYRETARTVLTHTAVLNTMREHQTPSSVLEMVVESQTEQLRAKALKYQQLCERYESYYRHTWQDALSAHGATLKPTR